MDALKAALQKSLEAKTSVETIVEKKTDEVNTT